MEHITPLLLITAAAWVGCEPLQKAIQRRSEPFGAYADKYTQNYEPYMYAAVPLHPPLPLLHILSPTPISAVKQDLHHSASVHRPTYKQRPRASFGKTHLEDYEEISRPEYSYSEYPAKTPHAVSTYSYKMYKDSDYAPSYPSPVPHLYVKPTYPTSVQYTYPTQEASAAILYASPSADGGYTYSKRPTKKRTAPKTPPPPPTEAPVILRIHKYKVVTDYKR